MEVPTNAGSTPVHWICVTWWECQLCQKSPKLEKYQNALYIFWILRKEIKGPNALQSRNANFGRKCQKRKEAMMQLSLIRKSSFRVSGVPVEAMRALWLWALWVMWVRNFALGFFFPVRNDARFQAKFSDPTRINAGVNSVTLRDGEVRLTKFWQNWQNWANLTKNWAKLSKQTKLNKIDKTDKIERTKLPGKARLNTIALPCWIRSRIDDHRSPLTRNKKPGFGQKQLQVRDILAEFW